MAKKSKVPDTSDISSYIDSLSARIDFLDSDSGDILSIVENQGLEIESSVKSLRSEMGSLRSEIDSLKSLIDEQKNILKVFAIVFKDLVKQEQFNRLKRAVDDWAPESFVTRNEVKKNIDMINFS